MWPHLHGIWRLGGWQVGRSTRHLQELDLLLQLTLHPAYCGPAEQHRGATSIPCLPVQVWQAHVMGSVKHPNKQAAAACGPWLPTGQCNTHPTPRRTCCPADQASIRGGRKGCESPQHALFCNLRLGGSRVVRPSRHFLLCSGGPSNAERIAFKLADLKKKWGRNFRRTIEIFSSEGGRAPRTLCTLC